MDTKACNLTDEEVEALLVITGQKLGWPNANINELMERLNYLHKRLKAFDESEVKVKKSEVKTSGFTASPEASQGWNNPA